jgi:hypothetical protein
MFGILILLGIIVLMIVLFKKMDESTEGVLSDAIDVFLFWPFHLYSFIIGVLKKATNSVVGSYKENRE